MILTAVMQSTQPDYVALVMVLALAVIVAVMAIRKGMTRKNTAEVEKLPTEAISVPDAPGSAGQIKLHNVEPRTAAMVMAIVAEKTGKPLNELRFISIKEVQ